MSESLPVTINTPARRLWIIWLLYLFQFLAVGSYGTYLNVYYRQSGLSGTQIGLISMTSSIIGMASAVMWGFISDRTGKPRLLLAGGAVGSALVVQFIPLVRSFWGFYGLACISSLVTSSLGTLIDGTILVLLGPKSEQYGRYRMGGTLGYLISTGVSGFVFDRTGLGLIFPTYGFMMALFAFTALMLPSIPVKRTPKARAEIGQMMRQPAWLFLAATVFLVWVANTALMGYLGVSLLSMGATKAQIGLASTTGALIELPLMIFSGYFIHRFGPQRLIIAAIGIMIVRYALFGWMPTPGWAIAINLMNGPAFVFFSTSAINYANRLAPPALVATSQGLLNSTSSLAGVVSALFAGILFDRIGPHGMFDVMAVVCTFAIIIFAIGIYLSKKTLILASGEPVRPEER